MTPPDSGAREVTQCLCGKWHNLTPTPILIPADLAQRILAALEGAGFTDLHYRGLAAELRERLPR